MKNFILSTALIASLAISSHARNEVLEFSFNEAINSPEAKEVLPKDIKFSFGANQKGTIILKGLISKKSTNAFNKTDEKACNWALYSALKSFAARAKENNSKRVINLQSWLDKKTIADKSKFQCRVGTFTARVILQGDIAK